MASIDKMAIRGIRSFDEKDPNIIQFYNPLTLIVGTNGSGKTTIIECLKYATTGDLPPNTKGGAFVHDPKLSRAKEVKAQVRLRFFNTAGDRMNCVRSLQVTTKGNTGALTMKTLEGVLNFDNDYNKAHGKAKRSVLSTTCAEINEEMPSLLGVSKAVLDNVIFCHQEDSNWPLSEPSALKKKFDDIFEATRWTKALENIKTLRKTRTQDLKVEVAHLDGLRQDKVRADAIVEKKSQLENSLAKKNEELKNLQDDIAIATKNVKATYDMAIKYKETLHKVAAMEDKESLHKENLAALKMTMTEINESDEELRRRKESFKAHLDTNRSRLDQVSRKVSNKKDEARTLENKSNKALTEKGSLEADKKNHENTLLERERQIRRISGEMGIKGYDMEGLSDDQIREFTKRLGEELEKQQNALNKLKEAAAAKEKELTATHQNLRADQRAKQASRDSAAENARRLKSRRKKAIDDLEAVAISQLDIDSGEKELADAKSKHESLQAELNSHDFDAKILSKNRDIKAADDQREELTIELNTLNKHAESRAKLGVKKKEIDERKSGVDRLIESNRETFSRFKSSELQAKTMDTEVSRLISSKESDIRDAQRREAEKNKVVQQIESNLGFARKQSREKTKAAEDAETAISELIQKNLDDGSTLQEQLTVIEEEMKACVDQIAMGEHGINFFNSLLEKLKSKHICDACQRGVDDAEMETVEGHLKAKMTIYSKAALEEAKNDYPAWQVRHKEVTEMLPKKAMIDSIRSKELPALKTQIEEEERKLTVSSKEAEEIASEVEKLQRDLRDLQALKSVAQEISRLLAEQEKLKSEVEELEGDLSSSGSLKTGTEVRESIDGLADQLRKLRRELLDLQNERESLRNKISTAERGIHRAEISVGTLRQQLSSRANLQSRVNEITSELSDAEKLVSQLEVELDEAAAPIRKASDELEKARTQHQRDEEELTRKFNAVQQNFNSIRELHRRVRNFGESRTLAKLEEMEDKINGYKNSIKTIQSEIEALDKESASINKELNESKATERNILDNIRCRQLEREINEINVEKEGMDIAGAQKAAREFNNQYQRDNQKVNEMNGEAQHLSGEIAGIKSQIKGRDAELKDEYKDVKKRYFSKLIAVKLSEYANKDLEKYAKGIDDAIMKFHSYKMEEINQALGLLWSKTYQGTDIDKIMIKSESEGGKDKRSYNYRVCMVKDEIEMDMRGRCSAGQKVLASIIIRLALQESFSNNCSILALDEPTTNLDSENISALATSLAELIKEREHQENFQLIVITHDENFLTNLHSKGATMEKYWRVRRDPTSQNSEIISDNVLTS